MNGVDRVFGVAGNGLEKDGAMESDAAICREAASLCLNRFPSPSVPPSARGASATCRRRCPSNVALMPIVSHRTAMYAGGEDTSSD